MLIRDWFFRLYGDVAHDWRFCAVMAAIVLLVCWMSAEGVVSVGHKLERWARERKQARTAAPSAPADPLAAQIADLIAGVERECRQHAARKDVP